MSGIQRMDALLARPRRLGLSLRVHFKRIALGVAAVAILAGGGWFGFDYWTNGRFLESTDDAYVQADFTTVAPKVSGYIAEVPVDDNQSVKPGQTLARIDDRDFRTALAQARADVVAARADIANIGAQLEEQQQLIAQAQATITTDQAAVTFSQQEFDRFQNLMKTGYGTAERAQFAQADILEKTSALERDRAALAAAQKQVDVLQSSLERAKAALLHDQAVADQAQLNLEYTTIIAPIAGTIGDRAVRVGQFVQAGTQLMAVVPLAEVYVVANFKETQLTFVRKGQPVEIAVDAFPAAAVHGHVDSLAPASGQEFALLPPDNATGNFTKIVQRVPVKIALDPSDPLVGQLRPGMSVEATIDTRVAASGGR